MDLLFCDIVLSLKSLGMPDFIAFGRSSVPADHPFLVRHPIEASSGLWCVLDRQKQSLFDVMSGYVTFKQLLQRWARGPGL